MGSPRRVTPLLDAHRKEKFVNGIAILGALPGSPAEQCGLKYGDLLLSINGKSMSSVEDFLAARSAADGTMDLLVRRGNHVMEFSLDIAKAKEAKKVSATQAIETMSHLSLVPPPAPDRGSLN